MKKLVLTISLCLSAVSILMAQKTPVILDNVKYYFVDDHYQVGNGNNGSGHNSGNELVIHSVIPAAENETANDIPVTTIGERAFCYDNGVKSVIIEEGVSTIKKLAFCHSENLESVTLPSSINSIEESSFNYAYSLSSITIPEGITVIGNSTFTGCSSLAEVNLPSTLITIGFEAFRQCAFSEITIPEGVTTVDQGVFMECTNLKSLVFPEGVTLVGSQCFNGCTSLESVSLPEGLKNISYTTFNNCISLKSIHIPSTVTDIMDGAFDYCSSLESITVAEGNTVFDSRNNCNAIIKNDGKIILGCKNTVIPTDGYFSIGDNAFVGCSGLTNLHIPASVMMIWRGEAFVGCSGLETITVDAANPNYDSRNNCNAIIEKRDNKNLLVLGCKNTIIPETVKEIGKAAFKFNTGLETIAIPNNVKIGESVFDGCTNLTTVTLGEGITSIDYYCFNECSSLKSITFPASITKIGNHAFWNCSGLEVVTFKGGVPQSVNGGAFHGVGTAEDRVPLYVKVQYIADFEDAVSSNNMLWGGYFIILKEGDPMPLRPQELVIKDHVKYYFNYQDNCYQVGNGTSAAMNGFDNDGSQNLDLVILGSIPAADNGTNQDYPVYVIGAHALRDGHHFIQSVVVNEGIKIINSSAFEDIYTMTSIELPSTLQEIKGSAFISDFGLRNVRFRGDLPTVNSSSFRYVGTADDRCHLFVPDAYLSNYQTALGADGRLGDGYFDLRSDSEWTLIDVVEHAKRPQPVYSIQGIAVPYENSISKGILIKGKKKYIIH